MTTVRGVVTAVSPFKVTHRVGTIDTGYRSRAVVTIECEWDGTRLSIVADVKRPRASDIDAFGQMQDRLREAEIEFAPGWDDARLSRLLDLWDRWHLNDMRAGCEHQRAAGWDERPIDPAKPTNAYGIHYKRQRYESRNRLAEVRPDEYPDGLLTRPCPECGYRYGTAWLTEPVPPDVLAAVLRGAE